MQAERARLKRFWHYFKRRALEHRITAGIAAGAHAQRGSGRGGEPPYEALEKEPTPEFPGLSLEARRAINLAAVAWRKCCASGSRAPISCSSRKRPPPGARLPMNTARRANARR